MRAALAAVLLSASVVCAQEQFGSLDIHYINVGQGGSTLIIGPNGTSVLYDFGKKKGTEIRNYLAAEDRLTQRRAVDFTIVSHADTDHYVGFREVVGDNGFDVLVANYAPVVPESPSAKMKEVWLSPAENTAAGEVRAIPLGLRISLGDTAELIVVATNGRIIGGGDVPVKNKNDQSVALLIWYRDFHFLLDGDLGGGEETCSQHATSQLDVQTPLAEALVAQKLIPMDFGVDVLHISHHGSESSTPVTYLNVVKPEVGVISVGAPNKGFRHPRVDVVDRLLYRLMDDEEGLRSVQSTYDATKDEAKQTECDMDYKPLLDVFQTDEGTLGCTNSSQLDCTSQLGVVSGDIVIKTRGNEGYKVFGSGRTKAGNSEIGTKVCEYPFDEDLTQNGKQCFPVSPSDVENGETPPPTNPSGDPASTEIGDDEM